MEVIFRGVNKPPKVVLSIKRNGNIKVQVWGMTQHGNSKHIACLTGQQVEIVQMDKDTGQPLINPKWHLDNVDDSVFIGSGDVISGPVDTFTIYNADTFLLKSKGKAYKDFKLKFIASEPPKISEVFAEGPSQYSSLTTADFVDGKTEARYWVDQCVKYGHTGFRFIALSGLWHGLGSVAFPKNLRVLKTVENRYNIMEMSRAWLNRVRADMYYALLKGIRPTIDLFDEVSLEGNNWNDHYFNGQRNIHTHFVENQPYLDHDGAPYILPGGYPQRLDRKNGIEHALKQDYGPESVEYGEILYEGWARPIVEALPAGCWVCPSNENESRTFDRMCVDRIRRWRGRALLIQINGKYNWHRSQWPQDKGKKLAEDSALYGRIDGVRQHNIGVAEVIPALFAYSELWKAYPHLLTIHDNDGKGGGHDRGKNNRPYIHQVAEATYRSRDILGESYGGFNWKLVGADMEGVRADGIEHLKSIV